MASSNPRNHTRWLPLGTLQYDDEIQRSQFDAARAQRMAREANLDALGVIEVSERADGTRWVLDGMHRCEMLKLYGFAPADKVECKVHTGLTRAQEAALFHTLNDSVKLRPYDRFRARVIAREPVAVAIADIVEEFGLKLAQYSATGHVSAVTSLEKIYRGDRQTPKPENPDVLRAVLETVLASWGDAAESLNGDVLVAIGLVLHRYGAEVDRARLRKVLAIAPGGASGLLGRGRTMREFRGGTIPRATAAVIVDSYNKGQRAKKLADWWTS